jgi:SAM-dependent methyltransferase
MFKRIGCVPLYSAAARIDNCNFASQTIWEGAIREGSTFHYHRLRTPGRQYVAEATDLGHIPASSYDFVLSSHTLEHVANPLKALAEWRRVLKDNGIFLLVLPHRDGTFDHRRQVTSLAHLVRDYEEDMGEEDLTHLEEIVALHDFSLDPGAGDMDSFKRRSMRNVENRCLHHHVFDTPLAIETVHHMGFQILHVEPFRPCNILLLAQKPAAGEQLENEKFRRTRPPLQWHSPFPSDRAA